MLCTKVIIKHYSIIVLQSCPNPAAGYEDQIEAVNTLPYRMVLYTASKSISCGIGLLHMHEQTQFIQPQVPNLPIIYMGQLILCKLHWRQPAAVAQFATIYGTVAQPCILYS